VSRRRALLAGHLRIPAIRAGLLVLAVALLGLAVVWPLLLRPAESEHATQRERAAGLSRALTELREREAQAERHARLAAQAEALEARLRAPVDRSALVERMSALSAAAGTRVVHGANRFGEERAGLTPVVQDLTVEGSYAQVRDFLGRVAAMETLTLLDSVEMSANPDGTLVRARARFVTLSEGAA
jgi:hypothetical protein